MPDYGVFGPFRPSPGRPPPYLAGRGREQSVFRRLLTELEERRPPPREVVLYGPRGNGKTTLLAWVEREAAPGTRVEVLRVTPSEFHGSEDLAGLLRPRRWWRRIVPDSLSVKGVRFRSPGRSASRLKEIVRRRVERRPLALLVDEAHTLDKKAGRALLNCSQQVGAELPFLLVLAGTPDLRTRLNTLQASFWNRAEILPIGRLPLAEAEEALRRPFAAAGIAVSDDALAQMVGESYGYPFFIQLWGEAVWNSIRASSTEPPTEVTIADVQEAQRDFNRRRDLYYADRLQELEDRDLLPVARAVARAFRDRERMDTESVEEVVREALAGRSGREAVGAARQALRHLGFIWREGGSRDWEPGIPSLMDYIAAPSENRSR